MRPVTIALTALLTICILFACASTEFIQRSREALIHSASICELTVANVEELHELGLVTGEVRSKAVLLAGVFKEANAIAIMALDAYEELNSEETRQAHVSATIKASGALIRLLDFIRPYEREPK